MTLSTLRVSELILQQLGHGEMRILSLVVAVRRALPALEGIKGDLPTTVKFALRNLIASSSVIESDGVYSLAPAKAKAS